MLTVSKAIDEFIRIIKWVTVFICVIMMMVIVVGVVFRIFEQPIVGSDESVEILLVVLIMFSIAYSQSVDGHIKIGIIVDRFPQSIQKAIDLFSNVVTAILGFIVAYIFFRAAVDNFINIATEATALFRFPHYILKFVSALGFFMWGLEALNQLIKSSIGALPTENPIKKGVSL